MRQALAALALLGSACGAPSVPVHLRLGTQGGRAAIAVVATDGARLNARLPPALELAGGRVVRIDAGPVDAAGDYFISEAWTPRPEGLPADAQLRVSFCRAREGLCRSATLPVHLSPGS